MIVAKETFKQLVEYRDIIKTCATRVEEARADKNDLIEEFWQKEREYWTSCRDNLIHVCRNGGYN